MSDVTQQTEETADAPTPSTIISVPVVKGKGVIDIDTSQLPDDVYREVLLQGLKVLANRGTSKVTKTTYPNEAELKTKAMEVAEAQKTAMYEGKIKLTGGAKATKVSGAVKTEAMRLARNLVKDELKRQKIKISHVAASDITTAAKALLEQDNSLILQAEENLKAREAVPVGEKINISALIKIDPRKKAAADAKAAKAKAEGLSAKQAGMVQARSKGGKGKPAGATAH